MEQNNSGDGRKRRWFEILEPISFRSQVVLSIAAIVTFLGGYAILSYGSVIEQPEIFAPSFGKILSAGYEMAKDGTLWKDLWASLWRTGAGFLVAVALAAPLGICMGAFAAANSYGGLMINIIRPVPPVAMLSLIIAYVGIGDISKILLIFIAVFFDLAPKITMEVASTPKRLVDDVYTLGASRLQTVFFALIPLNLPGIFRQIRDSMPIAWAYLVISELLASNAGLGFRIVKSQRFLKIDRILFILVLIGLLVVTFNWILKTLTNKLFPWDPVVIAETSEAKH